MDPVLISVLARRFESIARRMQHTLVRSARSGVISSGHDCSCCVLSKRAELLSVAQTIPIHVMAGADAMARSMAVLHPELRRGDAFLHNSPHLGGTHAADFTVLVPVVDEAGGHRFTVLAKAHQADIGNARPTTYMAEAPDIYAEGALIFPAVHIEREYRLVEDIVRIGMARIRAPEQWRGDLLALIGAARTGESELRALAADYGWSPLVDFAAAWLDRSEQRMRDVIAGLPAGTAHGESRHDPFPGTPADGVLVRAGVAIDPAAERITVDLRDNPDVLPCGLNLSEATARASALIGVFNGIGRDVPANAGSIRRVRVCLREGCVVGVPPREASCSVATTNLADRVVNAVHRAMASLSPDLGMAEVGAIEGPAGAVISGRDPRHRGRSYVNQLALADTGGAAGPREDAWLTMGNACTAGMWTLDSVEASELKYPLRVWERRLAADTEGAGQFRGAPACRLTFGPVGGAMRLAYASDGCVNAARGVRGGTAGAPAGQWLHREAGGIEALPAVGDLEVAPGETVTASTAGGGGYGEPHERDPQRVCADVREGYMSVTRAEQVYGVACEANGTLDPTRTARLRKRLSRPPDAARG